MPGQRTPAHHRKSPGIVEVPAGHASTLDHQERALIVGQVELVDPLLDRHGVESGDAVRVAQGCVRLREDLPRALVVFVPGRLVDGLALGAGARADLLIDGPVPGLADGRGEWRYARGHDLGPEVGLEPMEVVAASLESLSIPVRGPRAAADAIARLKDQRLQACSSYFARSRAARKSRTNHDDVVHLRLLRQS